MKITQDVRDYAASLGIDAELALKQGLEEKGREFKEKGSKIYLKV
jgi:phosphomethylpyrimidine synthase